MSMLVLIRHSVTKIDRNTPSRDWPLTPAGLDLCVPLAEKLSDYGIDTLITSTETKAIETGKVVSAVLNVPVQSAAGLHEHERSGTGFIEKAEDFDSLVARFFTEASELVWGNETADEAYARFSQSVESIVSSHSGANVGIVSHGTVMSLFVSHVCGLDPFAFWNRLQLPSFIVLSYPKYSILEDITGVAP